MQTNKTAQQVSDLSGVFDVELEEKQSFPGCPVGTISAEYDDNGNLLKYEDTFGVWSTGHAKDLIHREQHVARDGCISQHPRTVTSFTPPTRARNAEIARLNRREGRVEADYTYSYANDNWDYTAIK